MLNTKDIKIGGSSNPKTLQPGNQILTIHSIELEEYKFKPGGLYLVLHCEGEDMGENFEGFFIDKENKSLGRYKGQVGRVKASEYAFVDGTTKSGIQVSRDQDILKFLKLLCIELDCLSWLEDQDGKHPTIESLIKKFNEDKPFKDKWINTCVAGKEYLNKEGYVNYELFFPKFSKAGAPFEAVNKIKSKLIKFNPDEHIKKKNIESISSFEGEEQNDNLDVKKDFKL